MNLKNQEELNSGYHKKYLNLLLMLQVVLLGEKHGK